MFNAIAAFKTYGVEFIAYDCEWISGAVLSFSYEGFTNFSVSFNELNIRNKIPGIIYLDNLSMFVIIND
jgi:hypothetical protein